VANLVILVVSIVSGFDIGGHLGTAFPTGGISRTCRMSTVLGAQLGYQKGRTRWEFAYSSFTFPTKGLNFYEINLHQLALTYRYEFFYQRDWGVGLDIGPVLGFVQRRASQRSEKGRSGGFHFGLILAQHQGRSLISAGLDNTLFAEWGKGGPVLTYFPILKAGVSYVF